MAATIHPSVTFRRVMALVEEDASIGICLVCGKEADGVEPDARQYRCRSCGQRFVYGAEEALMLVPS